MRKKSHIALAKGVVNGLDVSDRLSHKFTLYLSSIWPDCTPSFLTRRHCIEDTYAIWEKKLSNFVSKYKAKKDMNIASTWRLGVILHYVADYFTFPHNSHYDGNLKDHCIYEEELKHRMRAFVQAIKVGSMDKILVKNDLEKLTDYLKEKHAEYKMQEGNVDCDCEYSVSVCVMVVGTLLKIVANKNTVAVAA